ncbi:hypothetical protein SeMB42_g03526 [Synchytrium endobioticum]|uniref:Uncharacterized protein n=1 Tax=Synchytrium endobioticum TaxID=286115 RepID=A0A507D6E8_9FUNG|nr:hypothetical protein SeMB42_g03526 [Synchytrium endobioticum]TPX51247.1 hypothetical protein SeLEV6574_g00377 [Synchytrium endobioticum]
MTFKDLASLHLALQDNYNPLKTPLYIQGPSQSLPPIRCLTYSVDAPVSLDLTALTLQIHVGILESHSTD